MDESKIEVSSESQEEQVHENLSELRRDVELSPTKLREITNTNEFIERVIELNNNAKQSIEINRTREALIYLGQAERILQHAANYGKTIERTLIIHILHNEACCHQKMYELTKCSGYLEALIYNYNMHLKNTEASEHVENRKSKELVTIENIEKKNELAKYYLQFQVVNSQQQNHSGALIAGRKAVEILKANFREIFIVAKKLKKSPYEKKFDIELRSRIIDNASRLNDSFSFSDSKFMLSAALFFLKQWTQQLSSPSNKQKDRNYVLEQQFKHYSIGNPLNLLPMLYQESREQRQKNFSAKNILQKLLTLGICYFTIATELRYISTQKHPDNESARRASSEFKESELYHLLSVILIGFFVPFDILLMKHITSSFETHYKVNLLEMVGKVNRGDLQNYGSEREAEKYEAFLFPQSNRISESSSSIMISGIGDNMPGYEQQKDGNLTNTIPSIGGTMRTIKKNESPYEESVGGYCKKDDLTLKSLTNYAQKMQSSPNTLNKILTQPDSSKKLKQNPNKKTSKTKSKAKLLINNLTGLSFKKQIENPLLDRSPMPKSPKTHNLKYTSSSKDLKDSRGIVKIKTTHRVKISTQKIEYRKQGDKRQKKSPVMNFDYFTSKSKDLRKSTHTKNSNGLQNSKVQNTSRSSSRKESPVPNYFQPMTIKPGRKTIKSPRPDKQENPYTHVKPKQKKKMKKMTFQQYYL